MRVRVPGLFAALTLALWATTSPAQSDEDDLATRLGLSDLDSYRAALSGRAAAAGVPERGPPPVVSFRELWDHQERWAGQRVRIEGNVVRVFRQDAFGGFPPLVEIWLTTKAGDLFCTVFPQNGETSIAVKAATEPGAKVAFAGTFLKTIRYAAADQARLAPLIVGDRPPLRINPQARTGDRVAVVERSDTTDGARTGPRTRAWGILPQPPGRSRLGGCGGAAWWLGLVMALLAAAALAYLQVRPPAASRRRKTEDQAGREASLEFIRPEDAHGTAVSDARFS